MPRRAGGGSASPQQPRRRSREAELRAGDPDVDLLESEYNGEEIPGGSMATPDQNDVDDVDRAYGLTDEDGGDVVLSEESRARRDRHRWELDPRSKDVPR